MRNSIIFGFFTTFLFINCSSDDLVQINDEKLFGVWFENILIEEKNQISRLEYRFNEDNTYEIRRMRIDNLDGTILGYQYRELGNFSLRNDTLLFTNIKRYAGHDTEEEEFSEIENLQLIILNVPIKSSRKVEFRDNETILSFVTPPCNDTSSCLAPPILKKVEISIF